MTAFEGPEGSKYQRWLGELLTTAGADVGARVVTTGSQENLLRVQETPQSIALVQRDVLQHANAGGQADVRGLARAYEEAVWIAAPVGIERVEELQALDLGPSTSGAAFTFHRLKSAWTGLPPIEGVLGRAVAYPGLQGRLDVDDEPPWSEAELTALGLSWIPLGPGRIQRAVLQSPAYHETRRRLPDGRRLATVGIQSVLITSPDFDPELADRIVRALLAAQDADTSVFLGAADGPTASRFTDLGVPEHPTLIHLKRGPHPYRSFALALGAMLTLFGVSFGLWTNRFWERRARRRGENALQARRRGGLVAALFALLSWTLFAVLTLKAVELGPMLAGAEETSDLWRMNLGAVLSWLFVLVSIGYEAEVFPVTATGKLLAASVQMVGWAGALFVLSNLFLGAVERLLKRYLNRGVEMDLSGHLVICNWTPEAEVILREVRNGERLANLGPPRRIVVVASAAPEGLAEAFAGVDVVVGEVAQSSTLTRARVTSASAIVVLRSAEDPTLSDASTAATCLTIRGLERAADSPPIALFAEVLDAASGRDMRRLGVGGVGAEGAFQLDLLAETAISPFVSLFYEDLLRFDEDSVEFYSVPAPPQAVPGPISFGELAASVYRASLDADPDNPVVVVGVQPTGSGGEVLLNPRGDASRFDPLPQGANLLALAWSRPVLDRPVEGGAALDDALAQTGSNLRPAADEGGAEGEVPALGQGLRDHVVLCNWSDRAGADLLDRIRCTGMSNPIVVVTDQPVRFEDAPAFAGVSVIPMAPLASGALERVDLGNARAVVVLADEGQADPDSATLLLVLRLRKLFDDLSDDRPRPGISAEVRDPRRVESVRAAGADEAVCAREMLYRVFAQAVFNPAIVPCFRDLLRHSDDTCEAYIVGVPRPLLRAGAHFGTAVTWAAEGRKRAVGNPMVPVGVLFGGERLVVNPRGEERTRKLTREDRLIVLQYSR